MRLPTKKNSNRTLVTQLATNTIHTIGRRFRRKIRGRETCTPPQTNTRIKLQSHDRVGRHKVHWNHTRLVLQTETSAFFTTRIHLKSTQTIQLHKKEKRKPTMTKRNHHIWCQKTIWDTNICSAASEKFIQQVCGIFYF